MLQQPDCGKAKLLKNPKPLKGPDHGFNKVCLALRAGTARTKPAWDLFFGLLLMEAIFHNCSRGTKIWGRGGVVNLALIAACCDVSVPLKEHGAAQENKWKWRGITPHGCSPEHGGGQQGAEGRFGRSLGRGEGKGLLPGEITLRFWEGTGRNTCPTW